MRKKYLASTFNVSVSYEDYVLLCKNQFNFEVSLSNFLKIRAHEYRNIELLTHEDK